MLSNRSTRAFVTAIYGLHWKWQFDFLQKIRKQFGKVDNLINLKNLQNLFFRKIVGDWGTYPTYTSKGLCYFGGSMGTHC